MGLRGRIRRLQRAQRGDMISIELQDGTVKRFPREALAAACATNFEFLDAAAEGKELPEPHPLQVALHNAAHREPWHDTFVDLIDNPGPVPDLSEP